MSHIWRWPRSQFPAFAPNKVSTDEINAIINVFRPNDSHVSLRLFTRLPATARHTVFPHQSALPWMYHTHLNICMHLTCLNMIFFLLFFSPLYSARHPEQWRPAALPCRATPSLAGRLIRSVWCVLMRPRDATTGSWPVAAARCSSRGLSKVGLTRWGRSDTLTSVHITERKMCLEPANTGQIHTRS